MTISPIDSIYNQINELEVRFSDLLKQEFMQKDVAQLKATVDKAMKGSEQALESLQKDGVQMLQGFEDKLRAALAEKERIMEESPTIKESTTTTIDHISQAAALTADAKDTLKKSIG